MPAFEEKPAAVRLNVAHVIREEHQLRAQEFEKAKAVRDLEVNLRDSSEFEQWQRHNKEQARLEELERQQRSIRSP